MSGSYAPLCCISRPHASICVPVSELRPKASKEHQAIIVDWLNTRVVPACRNILKTNDVRMGLKKPEQDSNKRAASSEPAQLAEAVQAADVARPDPAQAADQSHSDRQTHDTSEAAAAAASDDGGAHAVPSEWDIAKSARER